MRKIVQTAALLLALCLLWAGLQASFAQDMAHIPAAFVDIGFGARPLGMGSAFVALANDVHAILWNPAGLVEAQFLEATFSYTKQLGLIPYHLAAFSHRPYPQFAHGEALIVSGDDVMRETTFYVAAAYSFAMGLTSLRIGGALSYKHASFGQPGSGNVSGSASGFGLDLGLKYVIGRHFALAMVLKEAFTYVQWNSSSLGKYSEGLPTRLRLGLAIRDINQFNFELDVEKSLYQDTMDRFYFGTERAVSNLFRLRGGFASNLDAEQNLNMCFGGSLVYPLRPDIRLFLDIAYIFQDIHNTFRLSFLFKMD